MPNIGLPEILIVLVIALIVFGPKRLPEMGRSLGRGIREFKDSITGDDEDEDEPREIERGQANESTRPLEGEVVHERKS
jgi:sec-independent protein translocase protein TatA